MTDIKPCPKCNSIRSVWDTDSMFCCDKCGLYFRHDGTVFDKNKPANDTVDTHIYFAMSGEYRKVGVTRNIESRISTLNSGNPIVVKVLYNTRPMPRSEARKHERHLHNLLGRWSANGEWYKLPTKQHAFVIGYLETLDA